MRTARTVATLAVLATTLATLFVVFSSLRPRRPERPLPRPLSRGDFIDYQDDLAELSELSEAANNGDPVAASDYLAVLTATGRPIDQTPLEALIAARQALDASPSIASAHFNLAVALNRLGFTPEARAEFEIAAELESSTEWAAEARKRAGALRNEERGAIPAGVDEHVEVLVDPARGRILASYLGARERGRDYSRPNPSSAQARLARAAAIHDARYDRFTARLLARLAQELSPRDELDPYAQRYYVVGALARRGRTREALALLRSLDSDAYAAKRDTGWSAQVIGEHGIHLVVRGDLPEALEVFERAFDDSVANRQRVLVALYADLARDIRARLMEAAFSRRDHAAAYAHAGSAHRAERWTPARIQDSLHPRAAIVEFVAYQDQVIAFVIRKDEMRVVTLDVSAAAVREAAAAMRDAETDHLPRAAALLHDRILTTVVPRLEGLETIAIVPHRELLGIPFGALFDTQRGQFLVERFKVVQAESATAAILASRRARDARNTALLAIAATDVDRNEFASLPALAGAGHEVDRIAALSRCARVLSGRDATPEAIQRQLAENAVVHYAGHIVRRGGDARLVLASDGVRDTLAATEIAHLSLENARVVVLAACRGASTGEPYALMPNVAEAFLAAGVPSVIASSYDIEDAAAPATMVRLHAFLRDGDDAADALRKTALVQLQSRIERPLALRFMAIGGTSSLVSDP